MPVERAALTEGDGTQWPKVAGLRLGRLNTARQMGRYSMFPKILRNYKILEDAG
jgi:hypothetical protein